MTQVYRALRVAPGDEGVLNVVIDAPPMNLIGPELVRDLVTLLGELESQRSASPGWPRIASHRDPHIRFRTEVRIRNDGSASEIRSRSSERR